MLAHDEPKAKPLIEAPAFQDALLDSMSEAVCVFTQDGIIVYTNPAGDRLFGYERGALLGKHVDALNGNQPEANAHLVRGVVDELKANGTWRGERRHRRKDGSPFVTLAKLKIVDWNGTPHILAIQQDLSAHSAAHEALRESEARLGLAVEAAELGVWDWDLVTKTFEYSPRAKAICGFALDAPVTYEDVVRATHPDDFPRTSALAQEALDPERRRHVTYEYRIVRPNGDIRWVIAFGYATFGFHAGVYRALRYVGTIQDITERRRLQQKERDYAEQFKLAMAAGRFALWSVDQANESVRRSPELNRLFGFPEDAIPSLADFESRYAPGVKERLEQLAQSVVSRGERALETEYPIVLPDGGQRWLHVRAEIRYDEDGAPLNAVGVVMDITERKVAEEALRESDSRFREAADSAPAPVWMTDRDGAVEFANAVMGEFAGLDRGKMMGDVWLRLLHPDDLPAVAKVRAEAWANNHAPYAFEARFRGGDGKWRWLEVSSKPRIDGAGRFLGYVGLAVDRTEAKRVLSALQESEARFRTMSESAPVMIWMSDPQGACLHLNRKLREFWAVTDDDIATFDWRSVLHAEDVDRVLGTVGAAVGRAEAFTVDGRYRDSNGQFRVLRTEARPRFADNGEFLGMIGVNTDMTDIVRAQQSQQLVLFELNHRVKNTLAVVQALAHKTFREDTVTKEARTTFTRRLEALSRAHNLLTQTNWERTYLSEVVQAATAVCGAGARHRIRAHGPHIALTARQSLSVAMAFHELATNAVKYGALSVDGGGLQVDWRVMQGDQPTLEIVWRECGGPKVAPPERTGFGVRLIEQALAHELAGASNLSFEREGVVCEMFVPLEPEQTEC